MKDYKIEVRVKNNKLFKHIKSAGYKNLAEFSKDNNIPYYAVYKALNFKTPLYGKKGNILSIWVKLGKIFKVLPEDLLPEKHHFDPLEKNKSEAEMDFQEIKCLLSPPDDPEELYIAEESKKNLLNYLDILSPIEKEVLFMRYGLNGEKEITGDKISEKLNLNRSRIFQIEHKAIRKLRHEDNLLNYKGKEN